MSVFATGARRTWAAGVIVLALMALCAAGSARAASTTVCVPELPSKPIVSANAKGECPPKGKKPITYKAAQLPDAATLAALDELLEHAPNAAGLDQLKELLAHFPTAASFDLLNEVLAHVQYSAEGVGKQPTVTFTGVNVQIINGAGKTATTNGMGNLVIGYAESFSGGGSHNLLLGESQEYASYGGLLSGAQNSAKGPFASLLGTQNTITGERDSIAGGHGNRASNFASSVSGGVFNEATSNSAWVGGGLEGKATQFYSSVVGGFHNTASGEFSLAAGGTGNTTGFRLSSIFGRTTTSTKAESESIP